MLIGNCQRRFPEFDRKIVSMYARGMTTREIQGHIGEIYGFEASPSLISAVTEAVMDEIAAWQNRPLEPCYPVVIMDAIRVNIRSDGAVSNKAFFVALAILPDGTRDVMGLWFQASEGAKFWAKVLNDLRNRGVQGILIAVVDGLKGFPQAIKAALPRTQVQTCVVHLLRHSISFASYKDHRAVAAALKAVYTAVDAEAAAKLIYLALNATSTEWKRSVREWHAMLFADNPHRGMLAPTPKLARSATFTL